MWFRSWFEALTTGSTRRAKLARGYRHKARRLFLEGLEDRSLMAFNVMAAYATGTGPFDLALTAIDAGSRSDLVTASATRT